MASPRELRGLVPVELAIVLGAAIAPLPIPAVVPLLVVASLSLWVRGRGLSDRLHAPALGAIVGAGAGGVGLGLGLLLGTPLVEAVTGQAVQWSMYPIESERAVVWKDPSVAIALPDIGVPPTLSAKDVAAPLLGDAECFQ